MNFENVLYLEEDLTFFWQMVFTSQKGSHGNSSSSQKEEGHKTSLTDKEDKKRQICKEGSCKSL